MTNEVQEEMSFEDAFNEIVGESEGNDYEADIEADIDEEVDHAEEVQETEEEVDDTPPDNERPRDEQGRFTTEEDPLAELERYKQEAQQWQHRYNSDLGRQNALQRKIQEQQAMIEELQKAPQQAAPEGSGMSQSEWDTLKEDFPEIAAAMEARLNLITNTYESKISRLEQSLQPIQQQAQQSYRQQQFDALAQQHPDWQQVAKSDDFNQWMQTQPEPVRALYNSDEAADAAYLIGTYKAHRGVKAPAPTDELKQRRQRQLQQGQTISNRGGRPKSSLPPEDDFEAAFNYFAER